jgi:hypothetical protein
VHHQDLELRDPNQGAEGGERVAAVGELVEGLDLVEPVLAELLIAVVLGESLPLVGSRSKMARYRAAIIRRLTAGYER